MDDHTAALESWQKHLLRHDSVIVDSCQGMHRSHLTCLTCRKESVKFDVYSNLSLSLEPSSSDDGRPISITDCLEQFTMGEQLDEQNAWYCPTCRKNVRALKMMKLWSTPDILILHLKRFTFDTCSKRGGLVRSKIESVVDFPIDTLDMEPYIQGPIDPAAPPSYAVRPASFTRTFCYLLDTSLTRSYTMYTFLVICRKRAFWIDTEQRSLHFHRS